MNGSCNDNDICMEADAEWAIYIHCLTGLIFTTRVCSYGKKYKTKAMSLAIRAETNILTSV